MLDIRITSDNKLKGSDTITVHNFMTKTCNRVKFGVLNRLFRPVFLQTTYSDRFINLIPAEGNLSLTTPRRFRY